MSTPDKYQLICVAPDGAHVRDSRHPTIKSAWETAADLGSKWFFYPIPLVVGAKGKRIVDTPEGVSCEWIGRSVKTFVAHLQAHEPEVADYIRGDTPLFILP